MRRGPRSIGGKAIDIVVSSAGQLDIVIANAGIGAQGTIEDNDGDEWRRVFEVNAFGAARIARAAMPRLRSSSAGSLVFTSSIAAAAGLQDHALYSASKGALNAMTLAIAADSVAFEVRANTVVPGTADTPWIGRLLSRAADPQAERDALEQRQPLGSLVRPEEVADAVAYLASPRSGSTIGATLPVDGGMNTLRVRPGRTHDHG